METEDNLKTEADQNEEYSDLISYIFEAVQTKFYCIFGIAGVVLLSPLLLLKTVTVDRIMGWLIFIARVMFRLRLLIFFPFFILHELLHMVFASAALFHPRISFLRFIKPTLDTLKSLEETFTMGMVLSVPDDNERSIPVIVLVILISFAPAFGFVLSAWAASHTTNPLSLSYIILGTLWFIPSSGDRQIINDGRRLLMVKIKDS